MTHAALSFVEPRAPVATLDGQPYATLDSSNAVANLGATGHADFATAAHAGGAHPMISLGGAGAGAGFAAAASAANQTAVHRRLVAAVRASGATTASTSTGRIDSTSDFQTLVLALRAAAPSGFLITVPVGAVNNNLGIDAATAALWTAVAGWSIRLNVMTYTGSGNYPGWVVWYLDPLTGAGADHPFDVAVVAGGLGGARDPEVEARRRHRLLRPGGQRAGDGALQSTAARRCTRTTPSSRTATSSVTSRPRAARVALGRHRDDHLAVVATRVPPGLDGSVPGRSGTRDAVPDLRGVPTVMAKGAWLKANGYGGVIIWTINEGTQYPTAPTATPTRCSTRPRLALR